MQSFRAGLILTLFFCLTLPLMPVQLLLVAARSRHARSLPHWYHRQVCRLLGVRLHVEGIVPENRPALLVSNHVSWLDICVLSAVAPLSFVAKREVGSWPFISWLARLQRSIFVDRERRGAAGDTAREILGRLRGGDTIVLFAEGTSSDGNRVLPFRTALFAAAKPGGEEAVELEKGIAVQTLAITYTKLHGLPLGRRDRPRVAWYGDMELAGHCWRLLRLGPLDAHIRLGDPVPLKASRDRKALARFTERQVRRNVAELLSPRH